MSGTRINAFLSSPITGMIGMIAIPAAIFAAIFIPISSIPSPYDRAVIVKICRDGNRILRMENGEYRALRPGALRGLKVENPETVCSQ